ncbi:hypothetical protein Aglo03_35200 [Actinokineospora globicatena]|uniref:Uncharacterized protein n=1 Tax=Actinokineospora globicatena TaxID=103729 RepID=A0A9W6VA77_9PSEU|nr:hypothetical protein Aglo03_35200 [Actinokineospora globicatena]
MLPSLAPRAPDRYGSQFIAVQQLQLDNKLTMKHDKFFWTQRPQPTFNAPQSGINASLIKRLTRTDHLPEIEPHEQPPSPAPGNIRRLGASRIFLPGEALRLNSGHPLLRNKIDRYVDWPDPGDLGQVSALEQGNWTADMAHEIRKFVKVSRLGGCSGDHR